MFEENVKRRITAIAILLNHADKKGIGNVAKSAYYRSATILVCTVVEGTVYQLVKLHSQGNGNKIGTITENKALHLLPESVLNRNDIFIGVVKQIEQHIDDKGVTFEKLNKYLLEHGLISQEEFQSLDYVRNQRNKLHLQGLGVKDTGYTKNKFNKVSEPLDFLTRIIDKL